jgi:cytochrome c oxidase subunit 2
VTVPVGQKAKIRVRNVDTVTHGFGIPGLGVEAQEIKAGHNIVVEFTPEKTGTYDFYCTRWCGEHHMQMRGVIEVVDN